MRKLAAVFALLFIATPLLAQEEGISSLTEDEQIDILGSYQDVTAIAYDDRFGENSANAAVMLNDGERLSILCYENGTNALSLQIDEFLGISLGDDEVVRRRVLYKFDDGSVHEADWIQVDTSVTGSQIGLYEQDPETASHFERFIREAKSARKVFLRVYDYENNSSDHEFSLMGFSAAYETACGS